MRHPKQIIHQTGYTLIELLLYIAIISILLTSVTAFFGIAVEARVKNQSINEVEDQGTAAMEYITQTIRNATSITTPTAGNSLATLTLAVPTGSLNPTVFSLSGTTLQVQENATTTALTSNDVQVSNLSFKNLTASGTSGIVQIKFDMKRANPQNRNEYDYTKTFTASAAIGW